MPPGGLVGKQHAQDGVDEVVKELVDNQAAYGGRAGNTTEKIDKLKALNTKLDQIDRFFEPAAKLAEMLKESRVVVEDQREKLIRSLASSIDAQLKEEGNEDLEARYEKTRAYRSAIANKAAKTRSRNGEAEGDG